MFEEHNMEIDKDTIKRMAEGEKITDKGFVYSISRSEDDGYWGVGRYVPGEGGNWMPFSKRMTEKTIEKMINYIKGLD